MIAAVAIAVATPLLSPRRPEHDDARVEKLAALEARKEAKFREIRDAELDFRAGKLAEADYRTLDRALRREAITVLNEIDELREEGQQSVGELPKID